MPLYLNFLCWSWRQATICFANFQSPLSGRDVIFPLKGPNLQQMLQVITNPQLPNLSINIYNLKAQTSKLLLRISVTTTIPTTSECTLNTQIAPKPCNFNQIIWTHYIYNSLSCNHISSNQLFAKSHQLVNSSQTCKSKLS
jgi:hypothetical protein